VIAALLLGWAARGLDEAVRLCGEGRYVEALSEAQREADPLRRAQALLWVRHHAGDLDGALAQARAARALAAGDAWIAEREAYVALSLRLPREAAEATGLLEAALQPGTVPGEQAARWREAAASYRAEAEALARTLAARDRALERARIAVACGALLFAAGGAALAFRADRALPSR
jgi:hypothetical protein